MILVDELERALDAAHVAVVQGDGVRHVLPDYWDPLWLASRAAVLPRAASP